MTAQSTLSAPSTLSALPAIPVADGRATAKARVHDRPERVEDRTDRPPQSAKTTTAGWIFLGLVSAGLFTNIARYRRRLPKRYPIKPIGSLPLDPGPVPVPARLT